ncbi:response regulator [Priestia megaterium]|uniref:Bacterial regulatory s, luxR family protein n=1 Tax=Priestia megaterium (strain ATCC 14581 / DSM 32 / CCUG 1817 / JCM 2506 / NBRC 15308 / NCIMB 9376 / NCTC 10342 / NRRL B-14308 / VKM B-512 / Ford 19) TaxID=1348623 RepID=A0A0B6AQA8_PRIM2|nr:response regulator transcription factor [Priestia megaterium]AJI25671.1 bacterial regulatory s, luxR family protein [Priestia megaterium NBRC 15308 = ATCC 14581]KFN07523.1 bacterial regulatory s, luxR family protein [Priestia megaterium]MED4399227.1 response regulator transcription factor [Priestia megaterium]MED4737278.1 response regulator transcription factor [Priestia megaterium]WEZ31030.1 response regulator transcription factor [Priestia megaterium]
MDDKIKLMIVEDDLVWMQSISDYVQKDDDIIVVEQAYNKEEALQVDCTNIDVVLLDLSLSIDDENFSGLEVASYLYKKGLKKIIMLTSWDEKDIILECFDTGVVNYITKTSYRDIPNAIREAFRGKVSLHADVTNVLVGELRKERKVKILTPTEREVYTLKEQGLNKSQIADKLYKSVETIKRQLRIIKSKMQ